MCADNNNDILKEGHVRLKRKNVPVRNLQRTFVVAEFTSLHVVCVDFFSRLAMEESVRSIQEGVLRKASSPGKAQIHQ